MYIEKYTSILVGQQKTTPYIQVTDKGLCAINIAGYSWCVLIVILTSFTTQDAFTDGLSAEIFEQNEIANKHEIQARL